MKYEPSFQKNHFIGKSRDTFFPIRYLVESSAMHFFEISVSSDICRDTTVFAGGLLTMRDHLHLAKVTSQRVEKSGLLVKEDLFKDFGINFQLEIL